MRIINNKNILTKGVASVGLQLAVLGVVALFTFVVGQRTAYTNLNRTSTLGISNLPNLPTDGNLDFSKFVQPGSNFANWRDFSELLTQAGIDPAELGSRIEAVRSCAESSLGTVASTNLPLSGADLQTSLGTIMTSRAIGIDARKVAEDCVRQQLPPEILNMIGTGPLNAEMRKIAGKVKSCAMQCMTTLKNQANKGIGDFQNLTPAQVQEELKNQVQACVEVTCGDLAIPEGVLGKIESGLSKWQQRAQSESAAQGIETTPEGIGGFLQRVLGGLNLKPGN